MADHEKYMHIALEHAEEALERGQFPVGAVIVHRGEVLASGKRDHTLFRQGQVNEIDHAEILALRNLLAEDGGLPSDELFVYSTMEPCLMCYSTMILNGIRNIIYAYEDVMGGGTNLPLPELAPLYADMKIEIVPHVLRSESLSLFKQFFTDPENLYWKDSLLESYTLSQQL